MKKAVIAFVLMLSISASAQYEYQNEYKQSADKFNKVLIDCVAGRIYFEPSTGNEIQIFVKKMVYLDDEEDAKKLAEACQVEFDESGQSIKTIVELPSRRYLKQSIFKRIIHGDFSRELEILIKVMVPEKVKLSVETSSADVYVSNITGNDIEVRGSSSDVFLEKISGNVYVDVTSGDLEAFNIKGDIELDGSSSDYEIEDLTGNLRANTSSGDGMIDGIAGNVDIKTSSGEIRAYNVDGDLNSRSSSGDMVAENISGSAKISTSSGTVKLRRLTAKDGRFLVYTNSGDVTLEVNKDFEGEIELKSSSGDIDYELDEFSLNRRGRNYISGSVGHGKGEIEIDTSSGDISVESY